MALFGRQTHRSERRAAEYREWVQKRNPLAIASFVLGLFSLIEFGALLVFGLAGIVLGIIALIQLGRVGQNPGGPFAQPTGHYLAWGGIILSTISLALAGMMYLYLSPQG